MTSYIDYKSKQGFDSPASEHTYSKKRMDKENKSAQKTNNLNKSSCKEDFNRPKTIMVIPIELARACKENLLSIRSLKIKSPNFSVTDTILQISDTEKNFKSTKGKKKTIFSDQTTINDLPFTLKGRADGIFKNSTMGISSESDWKPSLRNIKEKQSEELDENKKQKSRFSEIADKYARNPILDGEKTIIPKQKPLKTIPEISNDYKTHTEKKVLLPSERSNRKKNNKPTWKTDSDIFNIKPKQKKEEPVQAYSPMERVKSYGDLCKGLLSYEFALPYRDDNLTQKINRQSMEERTFHFNDVNQEDYRRKWKLFKYRDE